MIREIMRDTEFLKIPSEPAITADAPVGCAVMDI